MTRIRPLSDLHFSHHPGGAAAFFSSFVQPDPDTYDVTVVAGDIGNPVMEGIEQVARHLVVGGRPVIYVPGNHDGYRGGAGSKFEFTFWEEQMQLLREFGAENGILIGDKQTFVIDDVRYVCATGWPEFAAELVPPGMTKVDAMSASQKGWFGDNPFNRVGVHNDFREIRSGRGNNRHNLTPSKMIEWAKADTAFLRSDLTQEFSGDTVVVTHVGSASLVEPGMHAWLYGSRANEDAIIEAGVSCWISGHTHRTFDQDLSGVRIVSNARGYPGEGRNFDPTMIVELGHDLTPRMGM